MEKGYVPENKAHHKPKSGSSARKKDATQAKKKGVSLEQDKSRNPKVRTLCSLEALAMPTSLLLQSIPSIEG